MRNQTSLLLNYPPTLHTPKTWNENVRQGSVLCSFHTLGRKMVLEIDSQAEASLVRTSDWDCKIRAPYSSSNPLEIILVRT